MSSTAAPIVCQDTTWLVSESRDRALTAEERHALEVHIAGCPLCQGASQQFKVLFQQLDLLLKQKS